nr:hypothetical protein [Tanacetum cinerariifolium]
SMDQTPSHTTQPTSSLLPVSTTSIPTVTSTETTPIRQYTRRARIAQSFALPPVADEPASPVRDVSQGEVCPTDSGFIADQDRVTIAKSSTLPHDSAPRVTSPVAEEGSMQPNITELKVLCTSLQRQHSELLAKFQAQEVEILKLKERVKVLEDREGIAATRSGDDAPIKGRSMDEGEEATERIRGIDDFPTGSGSIPTAGPPAIDIPTGSEVVPTATPRVTSPAADEGSMQPNITELTVVYTILQRQHSELLAKFQAQEVEILNGSIPTAGLPATDIPTSSDMVPTASPVFTTAIVVTPYSRRKGKEVMVESDTPKKHRLQEQIDAQVARELEEQQEREDKRMTEQIARDAEV